MTTHTSLRSSKSQNPYKVNYVQDIRLTYNKCTVQGFKTQIPWKYMFLCASPIICTQPRDKDRGKDRVL